MVKIKDLSDKIAGSCLAIIAVTRSLALMHGDSTLGTPTISLILNVVNYACLLCMLPFIIKGINKTYIHSSIILAICVSLFFIVSFLFSFGDEGGLNIVLFVIMMCFCFSNYNTKLFAFKLYRYFLILSALIGIFVFFSYILSLNIPYRIVPFYDREFGSYVDYKLAYLVVEFLSIRLCGLFNEPGYFGTILALVLIADNVNLKKVGNIIMFVAGLLTFSLAYFILILFVLLIKGFKSRKTTIAIVLSAIIMAFALSILADKYPDVENLLNRFVFEDGEWMGDNRSSNIVDITFEEMIRDDSNSLFGYGSGYTKYLDETGTSSYKGFIIDYGIAGAFVFWGLLVLASVIQIIRTSNKKEQYLFLLCFLLSIYQRPNVFTINFLLVLFGGLLSMDSTNKEDNFIENIIEDEEN